MLERLHAHIAVDGAQRPRRTDEVRTVVGYLRRPRRGATATGCEDGGVPVVHTGRSLKRRSVRRRTRRIRIGVGGWTYPPWRGVFYPDNLPQPKELEYASRQFGAIEINATFYGRQSPKSWETWAKAVPDGFQFAVKGSRYASPARSSPTRAKGIGNFFAQGMAALGRRSSDRSCGCSPLAGNSIARTSPPS